MLYYALFYATAIPTVVYAQVVGDENGEPTIIDDTSDSMIDLCDLPWLEDEACILPATQTSESV